MRQRFSRLLLSSMMFIGISLAACDAPAEQGESNLPESASTVAPSVEAPVPAGQQTDAVVPEQAPQSDVPPPSREVFSDAECDFEGWVGKPLDEAAVKATGRPHRIVTPGQPMTMDFRADSINVEHQDGKVTRVWCG